MAVFEYSCRHSSFRYTTNQDGADCNQLTEEISQRFGRQRNNDLTSTVLMSFTRRTYLSPTGDNARQVTMYNALSDLYELNSS